MTGFPVFSPSQALTDGVDRLPKDMSRPVENAPLSAG